MLWPQLDGTTLKRLDPGRFYTRRAVRIWPPYAVAVGAALCASVLMWRASGPSWWSDQPMQSVYPASADHLMGNIASHLTLTHGFVGGYDRSIDGAFWSLASEWQFYLLLPILVFAGRRWSIRAVVAAMASVTVVYVAVVHLVKPGLITDALGTDLIVYRMAEFGAGMLVAWLVASDRSVPFLSAAIPLGLVFAFAVDHYGPASLTSVGYAFGYGALLLGCARFSRLRRFSETATLRGLGRISYSAYLIHDTVYMLVAIPLTRIHASLSLRTAALVLVGIPLAVIAAKVLHRLVERPAVGWSHRLRGRPELVAVAA